MLYCVRYLQSSFSCVRLSICLFNSLFSSLQYTLMHFVGGNKDLPSSSKLVTIRVGIVVAAMTVGCRLLCLTLQCYMRGCCLQNRQLLKGVLLFWQPVEHSSVSVPLMELFFAMTQLNASNEVVNGHSQ